MSAVAGLHEFAGFSLAGALHGVIAAAGLPLLVALAGTAWLVHRMSAEDRPPRELLVHVLSLAVAAGLLSTTAVDTLRVPRLAVWTSRAADALQRRAVRTMSAGFLDDGFAWERLAAAAATGRVFDPDLASDVDLFLASCSATTLARAEPRSPNLLRPGSLPYGPRCERHRAAIWERLREHVRGDLRHRRVLELATARPDGGTGFEEAYLDLVATRAADGPGSPLGEDELAAVSVGRYAHTATSQSTGGLRGGGWAPDVDGGPVWTVLGDALDSGISVLAGIRQAWANRFAAKQAYYLVVAYGPHLYGLALMMALGLFPVAALWALLPGRWTAMAAWMRLIVSVKLWPVGWAALSAFNERRGALEALAPAPRGTGDAFLAIAAMYVAVPALAFAAVQALPAALPLGSLLPGAAGPGRISRPK